MTVKELMGVTGLGRVTITNKIKEFFPEIVKNGITIYLNEEQAIKVMDDLRKKGFVQPVKNEQVPVKNEQVNEDRLTRLENLVEKLITAIPLMINQNKPEQKALPSSSPISDRDAIRQLVNKAAKKENNDHAKIWGVLYEECYYRLHENYKIRAANAGMGTLEYIDNIGECHRVLEIAKDLFGNL